MGLKTRKIRRVKGKTDYKHRFGLLKSSLNRIVVRKTNKYFTIQSVESSEAKDKVLTSVISKDLTDYGWDKKAQGSLKSIPAAYLTGLLFAKKIGKGKFILDFGMARKHDGGRVYAVGKGLIDGGLDINMNEKVFPSEERLNGEHLKDEVKTMISKVKKEIESGKIKNKEKKK